MVGGGVVGGGVVPEPPELPPEPVDPDPLEPEVVEPDELVDEPAAGALEVLAGLVVGDELAPAPV